MLMVFDHLDSLSLSSSFKLSINYSDGLIGSAEFLEK